MKPAENPNPLPRWPTCLAALCAATVAAVVLVSMSRLSGGVTPVSAALVNVQETTLPACGPAMRSSRRVVMAGGYLARQSALRVARIEIVDGGRTWTVSREAGLCKVTDPDGGVSDQPCLLESCQDGYCAVRVPYVPAAGGTVAPSIRFADAGGGDLGRGAAVASVARPASAPALTVTRDKANLSIRAPAQPEGTARATVIRGGKAVADAPLGLDMEGRASLRVPSGVDKVMISVSSGDGDGVSVSQSTVHVEGPFDGSCAGPG